MHQKCFLILLLGLNLSLGACVHSSQTLSAQVPLKEIRSGQQMAGDSKTPGCMWITNENQLSGLMDGVGKGTKFSARPTLRPKIDFSAYGILAVWMGQKPTGGYALKLMDETAEIRNQTVLVPVRWIEPQKGMLTTQVIIHPYLMIRMAKGHYNRIVVIDQNGLVRTRADAKR